MPVQTVVKSVVARATSHPEIAKRIPKAPPLRVINAINRIRTGFTKIQKNLVPPPVVLMELVSGQWISQAISVAASLGIADHIDEHGASADDLAEKVGADPEALYRLLRALTVVGLFTEKRGRVFLLTSVGKCLRTDHPQSLRYMSIFQGQMNWANWGALEYSVKTGKNAFEHVVGEKPFEHLAKHPEKAETFDKAMTNVSKMAIEALLAAYDFTPFKTIADVGGGHGSLLAAILKSAPGSRGILFDLPHVAKVAADHFRTAGLSPRTDVVEGSFFETAPEGADAYVMKHIIHDWSDEESRTILKRIREKIPAHGKLLLLESVVPGPNEPHFSKFLDLEMLVVTTGKERTKGDYRELLASAGFKLERIVPTVSLGSIIEATPI